LLVDVVGNLIL